MLRRALGKPSDGEVLGVAGTRSVLPLGQRSTWEAGVLGTDSVERVEIAVCGAWRVATCGSGWR